MSSRASLAPLAVLAALLAPACRTPEEYKAAADREVGDIVRARRAELGAEDPFSIEPPPDGGPRGRLIAGEELPPLSLVDCLRLAADSSRDYRTRRESLFRAALTLTRLRFDFSVRPAAGADGAVSGDFDEAGSASVAPGARIEKLFASGATLLADASLQFTRSLSTGDGWDAISGLTIDVAQPLLAGFGARIVMEPLTQAERDVVYEARAYERFRRTLAFDVAARFYRILALRDTLGNERANQSSLQRLRERNEALAEAGRLSEIQVDQARQNELQADDRVVSALRDLESAKDDFKLFLGLPIHVPFELIPESADELGVMELVREDPERERAVELALAERLDLHTVRDRVRDAERKANIAANALGPRLDVSARLDVTSREGQPLTASSGGGQWTVGAGLGLPVGNLPERNAYRSALIDLVAARRAVEEASDRIQTDVRDDLRQLGAQRARLSIQRGAVILARRRVESTQLSLDAGRADTRDVLEAQEDLLLAENEVTRALTDYTLAALALFRDLDLLRVDESGVRVAAEELARP